MSVRWMTRSAAEERKLPKDWSDCRNEEEEARWWDANSGRIFDEAVRKGTLKITTLEEMVREAKRRERAGRQETKQLTLRVPVADLERAKEIGAKEGIGYQAVLKRAIHEGMEQGDRGKPLKMAATYVKRRGGSSKRSPATGRKAKSER